MLSEPAIWSSTELERRWHESISAIWQHDSACVPCALAVAANRQTVCSEGLALREAERAAWEATRADVYVPMALDGEQP